MGGKLQAFGQVGGGGRVREQTELGGWVVRLFNDAAGRKESETSFFFHGVLEAAQSLEKNSKVHQANLKMFKSLRSTSCSS